MSTSIIDQIMQLEAQKQALMGQAKKEALAAAEKAVADLNNLGFHYRLVESDDVGEHATTTRTRRTGVAEEVLDLIKKSPTGLSRGAVISQMNAHDKSTQQSISNALSNLKKKGLVTATDGLYRAA
jgi:hypothetical protein